MDQSRLSINSTGAYWHPLGDQTPIDCRYGEMLDSVDLPHKILRVIEAEHIVDYGPLKNPRACIVWTVSGQGLQSKPTEEEAAAIAAQQLLVGLTGPGGERVTGWQLLRPAKPGEQLGGSAILWLAPGTRVVLRPMNARVSVRVLVLPGQ
jgi:hypothetical protein